MPPAKGAASKAPATAPPLPPHLAIEGFKACKPGTHELLVDPKGWCSIPFNTDDDGFKSFRALIVPRGKTTHVPNVPGRYALFGSFDVLVPPLLVHFDPATNRKAELVTSFLDFAMGNAELSGVAVETLELPLKMSHNKYRTAPNVTNLENVIGFSPVPKAPPYTVDLEPTLKANALFQRLQISTDIDVIKFIDTPLFERVARLFQHAGDKLEDHMTEIGKAGNGRAVQTQRGIFQARLEKLKESIGKLPPQAYDARLNTRITVFSKDTLRPEWMASPLRDAMNEGAAQLVRTRLQQAASQNSKESPAAPRRLPTSPLSKDPIAKEAPTPNQGGEAGVGTDKSRKRMQALQSPLAGLNDSPKEGLVGDDSEDSDADSHVPSPAKRARTTTKHYAPQAAINLKKPAAKKPAACESKEEAALKRAGEKAQRERMAEHNVALGLKADGTAYKRGGAYHKKAGGVLSKAAAEQAKAAFEGSSAETTRFRTENSKLKHELAEVTASLKEAQSKLELKELLLQKEIFAAEAAVHMSYMAKMEAQFHKGAAFASQVSSGGVYTYKPNEASGSTNATPL